MLGSSSADCFGMQELLSITERLLKTKIARYKLASYGGSDMYLAIFNAIYSVTQAA